MSNTRVHNIDSDEPRVEMEKTIGLRRWMALHVVARRSALGYRDRMRRYIRNPLRRSHKAKRYFPKEGWTDSLALKTKARSGVYRYVARVYGLYKGVSRVKGAWGDDLLSKVQFKAK